MNIIAWTLPPHIHKYTTSTLETNLQISKYNVNVAEAKIRDVLGLEFLTQPYKTKSTNLELNL